MKRTVSIRHTAEPRTQSHPSLQGSTLQRHHHRRRQAQSYRSTPIAIRSVSHPAFVSNARLRYLHHRPRYTTCALNIGACATGNILFAVNYETSRSEFEHHLQGHEDLLSSSAARPPMQTSISARYSVYETECRSSSGSCCVNPRACPRGIQVTLCSGIAPFV